MLEQRLYTNVLLWMASNVPEMVFILTLTVHYGMKKDLTEIK